jgi:hypothetical protein
LQKGEAQGDVIADFNRNEGDRIEFMGYGTAAQGAKFIQLDATHWSINSYDGLVHDMLTMANGASVYSADYSFI